MMDGRPGREPLRFLPDEARSLPPPRLSDPRLLFSGFMGYGAALLDNALRQRPVLKSGLHRQLLYVTSFFFAGYYLLRRQEYIVAVRDHDMFAYIKSHPGDFPVKEKKRYREVLEEFYPVR
ncbi:NADH dehydrogenase [ubiquinone] 1 subunit C2 [Perognathus longimembris pacificus]|uniref:NADH dehydrogenase [ubiquinone] 1 subunit C2 n=1 Tax=Perognathus longimembris pacificus TaxID=214514 RepID=UPI0020198EA4|nr:NADH dehydrogenase [ubiquinone] 1 subunit C2 [Perognathus longimembris pacificus]